MEIKPATNAGCWPASFRSVFTGIETSCTNSLKTSEEWRTGSLSGFVVYKERQLVSVCVWYQAGAGCCGGQD